MKTPTWSNRVSGLCILSSYAKPTVPITRIQHLKQSTNPIRNLKHPNNNPMSLTLKNSKPTHSQFPQISSVSFQLRLNQTYQSPIALTTCSIVNHSHHSQNLSTSIPLPESQLPLPSSSNTLM
ncbi:hypothetical protein M758_4G196400 [Ceratodon purpureus]|uniref:Uncharacterized protein n=1 Tax=Ceratodon purpureus TaxID=3225 RepID=A0A8T0IE07_CERPU|nr:hypothetical protein KC19_4G193100 [Ceratodon purpureus]KAG0620184.1 hypothetical protein M758_4G196400 [Ceratodon purpureus]